MDLEKDSCEIDPDNLDKPLKMIGFRVSKETDWLLYAIHDVNYLIEKGLQREYVYSFDDIMSTDEDTLADIISHCSDDRNSKIEFRMIELMKMGLDWQEIVSSGFIPLRYMVGAKIMYDSSAVFFRQTNQK